MKATVTIPLRELDYLRNNVKELTEAINKVRIEYKDAANNEEPKIMKMHLSEQEMQELLLYLMTNISYINARISTI